LPWSSFWRGASRAEFYKPCPSVRLTPAANRCSASVVGGVKRRCNVRPAGRENTDYADYMDCAQVALPVVRNSGPRSFIGMPSLKNRVIRVIRVILFLGEIPTKILESKDQFSHRVRPRHAQGIGPADLA
jgi:hypothetical protein